MKFNVESLGFGASRPDIFKAPKPHAVKLRRISGGSGPLDETEDDFTKILDWVRERALHVPSNGLPVALVHGDIEQRIVVTITIKGQT